jgi:hypothetical protein
MGIAFCIHDRSVSGLAVPEKYPVGQGFALAGQNLDGLRALDSPDDAAGRAEYGKYFRRRTLGEKALKTCRFAGDQCGRLSVKAAYRSVNQGKAKGKGKSVEKKTGGEVVQGVHNMSLLTHGIYRWIYSLF